MCIRDRGVNVGIGSDDTLYAKESGVLRFERLGKDRKPVSYTHLNEAAEVHARLFAARERVKQAVIRGNARAGQRVQKRRLARVRVADDGDDGNFILDVYKRQPYSVRLLKQRYAYRFPPYF